MAFPREKMVDQLLDYIAKQEEAGYTDQQIRAVLENNGYSRQQIDSAFKTLSGKSDAIIHGYVEQYARSGYSAVQAHETLAQQGYSSRDIRKAIKEVYGPGKEDVQHTHIVLFSVLALIIGAGLMYLAMSFVRLPEGPGNIDPGGPVSFSPSEVIAGIIEGTRQEGPDYGVEQCKTRLRGRDRDRCFAALAVMEEVSDVNLCSLIVDPEVHDGCLVNFLNQNFSYVCENVKLAKTKQTCDSLESLR